jgi:hypothetical protein
MLALRSGFASSFVLFVVIGCGSSDSGGSGSSGSTGGASGSMGAGGTALGGSGGVIVGSTGGSSPSGGTGSSSGGSTSGTAGTEGGPCYPNSTCNAGLTCLSNLCVNPPGGTGGTGNGSGGIPNGTGGSPACTNTQTDPNNCGTCGHVCKNTDEQTRQICPSGGCCANGKCASYLGDCIQQSSGFSNCTEYCASIGETCAQAGCADTGRTWRGWGSTFLDRCQSLAQASSGSDLSCDTPFDWTMADRYYVRCCCTDTH